jgi:hypothetical protein
MTRQRSTEALRASVAQPACEWFALCDRPAAGTTAHPILGAVPTCDRCNEFAGGAPRTITEPLLGPGSESLLDRAMRDA